MKKRIFALLVSFLLTFTILSVYADERPDHNISYTAFAYTDDLLDASAKIGGFDLYVLCEREETAAGTLLCSTVSARKDDREIVTLHYFSGLPLPEVAQLVGRTYPAVRQRLVRLRKVLKQRMEEQGYDF